MGGREQDTSLGFPRADDVRGRGGGHDSVLADDELLDAVCGSHLDDRLDHLGRVEPPIASDNESDALGPAGDGREDGLDEVLGVVL